MSAAHDRKRLTPDDYRRCADAGMTMCEAAASLGVSRPAVWYMAHKYDVEFASGSTETRIPPARAQWARLAEAGMTMDEAAAARGVTRKAAYMAWHVHGIKFRDSDRADKPESPAVRKWRERAEAGMTARQAADDLGLSVNTARRVANAHGFKFAPHPRSPGRTKEAWLACAAAGMSAKEAAAHLGRKQRAADRAARAYDIKWQAAAGRLAALGLTERQIEDYRFLTRKHHYRPAEALRAVGRADLVEA